MIIMFYPVQIINFFIYFKKNNLGQKPCSNFGNFVFYENFARTALSAFKIADDDSLPFFGYHLLANVSRGRLPQKGCL